MELILETDIRMKTSFDEKERLLEMLVLQLAQEARSD
jgi:DNA polymerase III delta subunit